MPILRLCAVALVLSGCLGSAPRSASSTSALSSYCHTKNPIVLMHGLFGFKSLFGVVDYWFGVPQALQQCGAEVYVTGVTQANSSEVRGQEIITQLEQLRATTGATRFNLIGHSQGSLDARYVAATRPDLVASVTGVGGPEKGSPVADVLVGVAPLAVAGTVLADLIQLVSGSTAPAPNDMQAAFSTLTTSGAAKFNARYPQALPSDCGQGAPVVDGIRYYSWGGVGWITTGIDVTDALTAGLGTYIVGEENDGLVGRCSSHLGTVIRDDYFMNHLDEVNQLTGLVSPFGTSPRELFRMQANRLANDGV